MEKATHLQSQAGMLRARMYLVAPHTLLIMGNSENSDIGASVSTNINGVELKFNKFSIYPDKVVSIFSSQHVQSPWHTPMALVRTGCCNVSRAITLGPFGDLRVLSATWLQQRGESELMIIRVSTETSVSLTTAQPSPTDSPVKKAYLASISIIVAFPAYPINNYSNPEFPSLLSQLALRDLLFPLTPIGRKNVITSTQKLWNITRGRLDKYGMVQDDRIWMSQCKED